MTNYKSKRPVDGKPPIWVIVDENSKVVNRNPSKEELKIYKSEPRTDFDTYRYTDKELLDLLKQFVDKNRRVPTRREFRNNPSYPSSETYRRFFGSWNNALILAEVCTRKRYEKCTNEVLLNYLKQFYEEYERVPIYSDLKNNNEYPSIETYRQRFGGLNNALKLVGMDLDTRIMSGRLYTNREKGRLSEIIIIKLLGHKGIDLSGDNCSNYLDGICPNGMTYEVKSSKFYTELNSWIFGTKNRDKSDNVEAIQWWYFIAFNEDYTKLLYLWRVPGELIETDTIIIGKSNRHKFNLENMEKYNITDKIMKILANEKNELFNDFI
jgi:hypothetical protein